MALQRAVDRGNVNSFKFEKAGDTLKGYYLKTTEETINGSPAKKHLFKTTDGVVSVLGQANLYKQLVDNELLGAYIEATFTGELMRLKGGRTMKTYVVDYDKSDMCDSAAVEAAVAANDDYDDSEDAAPSDEVTPPRAVAPRNAATAPTADKQARAQALLNGSKTRS